MDKKDIVSLILGSAVIGAVFSAIVTAGLTLFNQWRERVARERELLLNLAVDLSKTYIERLAVNSRVAGSLPELVVLAGMHRMLKEVFEHGRVSQADLDRITAAGQTLL